MLVGDDGDKASGNRQAHLLANQRLISRIFRIHSYGHVGQHGFRPSRGYTDVARSIFQRITEVPELALHFLRLYLPVGNRRFSSWIPIDEPLVAMQQTAIIKLYENFDRSDEHTPEITSLMPIPSAVLCLKINKN